jgi:hypothetical protein
VDVGDQRRGLAVRHWGGRGIPPLSQVGSIADPGCHWNVEWSGAGMQGREGRRQAHTTYNTLHVMNRTQSKTKRSRTGVALCCLLARVDSTGYLERPL